MLVREGPRQPGRDRLQNRFDQSVRVVLRANQRSRSLDRFPFLRFPTTMTSSNSDQNPKRPLANPQHHLSPGQAYQNQRQKLRHCHPWRVFQSPAEPAPRQNQGQSPAQNLILPAKNHQNLMIRVKTTSGMPWNRKSNSTRLTLVLTINHDRHCV